MMQEYEFEVREKNRGSIRVKANSPEEAAEKADQEYAFGNTWWGRNEVDIIPSQQNKPANFTVIIAVNGRIHLRVNAATEEEAKRKACEEVCEIDFGSLEDIEWSAVNAAREASDE